MAKKKKVGVMCTLTKRYIFIKVNLNVFSVVIKFYCIYVTNLVFTFSFYKYKNHFEFPRVVRSPRLKFWKFLGGGGSSKTPCNGKSWGGGANQKVFHEGYGYFLEPHNCDSLVANATRNYGLVTRFLELVASGRLTFTFFSLTF